MLLIKSYKQGKYKKQLKILIDTIEIEVSCSLYC
jgi:hypothetical protein